MIDELLLKRADFVIGLALTVISLILGFLKDKIWPPTPSNTTHIEGGVTIHQVIQYLTPPPPRPDNNTSPNTNNNDIWIGGFVMTFAATVFFILQPYIMLALMFTPVLVLTYFMGLFASRLFSGYLTPSWLMVVVLGIGFNYADFLIVAGSLNPDYHPPDFNLVNRIFLDYGWKGVWRYYNWQGILWFMMYIIGIAAFFAINLIVVKTVRAYFKASSQLITGSPSRAQKPLRRTPKSIFIETTLFLVVAYFFSNGQAMDYWMNDMQGDIDWAVNRLINGTKG